VHGRWKIEERHSIHYKITLLFIVNFYNQLNTIYNLFNDGIPSVFHRYSDGIPSQLLQAYSLEIAPSICELFNHSLHSGHIPSEWKSANVTPVHKKERIEPAENYRPI
jgi:hypothetical protein